MKKLLLSALCMLGAYSFASANTATFDFSKQGYENAQALTTIVVNEDITLTADKGSNANNAPKYYNKGTDFRIYGGNTLTVAGAQGVAFEKVTFTCTSGYDINSDVTVSEGVLSGSVWTGSSNSFTLTIGDSAIRVTKITFEYTGGTAASTDPDPEPDPDPYVFVGDGSKVNAFTVEDVIKGATFSGKAWVKGYIVGYVNGSTLSADNARFTATAPEGETVSATNIMIAASADVTGINSVATVQLPAGTVRSAINLKDHADLLGHEVYLYGTLEKYFGVNGVKNVSDYELPGVVIEVAEYATLAEWLAAKPTTPAQVNAPATVVYQNGNYMWIVSDDTPMYVYGAIDHKYHNGSVIPAGYQGTYQNYLGLDEFIPVPASFQTGTNGTAVEPLEITCEELATDLVSTYIKIVGATVTHVEDRTYTINDGTTDVVLYNQFASDVVVTPGENLTVEGFLSIRNGVLQVFPISVTTAAGLEKIATPTVNIAGGEVYAGTTVKLACATSAASIYYTLDGTVPSAAATLYEAPIAINASCTLKAIAIAEGKEDSEILEVVYTIKEIGDVEGDTAVYDWTNPTSLNPYTEAPATASTGVNISGVIYSSNGTTFVAAVPEGITDTRIWCKGEGVYELRTYGKTDEGKQTLITITSVCDKAIASILFEGNSVNTKTTEYLTAAVGEFQNDMTKACQWNAPEGGAQEVTISVVKNCNIDKITVNYVVADVPAVAGDVDGNGEVDINDLGALVNIICGLGETTATSDVDGNGEVEIADLGALVNMICGL